MSKPSVTRSTQAAGAQSSLGAILSGLWVWFREIRAQSTAFVVAVALVGTSCAARNVSPVQAVTTVVGAAATAVAPGLTQVALFTLSELLQMRRSLDDAEHAVAAGQIQQAEARARAVDARRRAERGRLARSAAAGRLSVDADAAEAEAARAAAIAANADATLVAVEAQLAERLGLENVTPTGRAGAIRSRLAELEAELETQGARP